MQHVRKALPKIPDGMKRAYVACKTCDAPYYYDYIPFSLSTPIMVMPCGHGLTIRFVDATRTITMVEFRRLRSVKQRKPKKLKSNLSRNAATSG